VSPRARDAFASAGAGREAAPAARAGPLALARRLARIPLAVFGIGVILLVVAGGLLAPWLAPHDPQAMDFEAMFAGMTPAHPLGTDQLGRDTLSRLVFASRIALIVSLGAVGLGVAIGLPLGLLAAQAGGLVDDAIMRVMDALVVFPSLVLAVGLAAVLGSSLTTVIVSIGVANVPWLARVVRSEALVVRELDFVSAARCLGVDPLRLMWRHVLPNSLAPVIVQATLGMGYAILTEAALGFIGVGVRPPTPTWGNMLQQAFGHLERSAILSIAPGMAIFALVLAFNFVGDALRDVLDPRLKSVVAS
jgi:peptide/nickel transport system permease protein